MHIQQIKIIRCITSCIFLFHLWEILVVYPINTSSLLKSFMDLILYDEKIKEPNNFSIQHIYQEKCQHADSFWVHESFNFTSVKKKDCKAKRLLRNSVGKFIFLVLHVQRCLSSSKKNKNTQKEFLNVQFLTIVNVSKSTW